jgi:hypothetical protein
MVTVKFKYRDAMSNWEWREQSCYVRNVAECKRIYGLGTDCEYQIISVEGEEEYERRTHSRPLSPYERTRNAVYATGNKWAIENFNATH